MGADISVGLRARWEPAEPPRRNERRIRLTDASICEGAQIGLSASSKPCFPLVTVEQLVEALRRNSHLLGDLGPRTSGSVGQHQDAEFRRIEVASEVIQEHLPVPSLVGCLNRIRARCPIERLKRNVAPPTRAAVLIDRASLRYANQPRVEVVGLLATTAVLQ